MVTIDMLTEEVKQRFWEKVNKTDGCWLWTGANAGEKCPHGRLSVGGKLVGAHRISWVIHYGEIPDGLEVCHDCPGGDNPKCTNPDHLFLGTQKDNMRDAAAKGRMGKARGDRNAMRLYPGLLRGEKNGRAKLNEDQVREIRSQHAQCHSSYKELAIKYGVTKTLVGLIVTRKNWKHVA